MLVNNCKYFIREEMKEVIGKCQQIISSQQSNWRYIEPLEQYPFERISKYCRNINYKEQNTRSIPTLERSLKYLIQNIWPLILQRKQLERLKVMDFIYQRLKAIRCQYFVQGVIYPKELIKIIRIVIILDVLRQHKLELIGIENLLSLQNREEMLANHKDIYYEALSYSIYTTSKHDLMRLLEENPCILEDCHQLKDQLSIRLKIQGNNYHSYFQALKEQSPIIKCLLWSRIEGQREKICKIVRKSCLEVPLAWISQILGFHPEEGWINLKTEEVFKGKYVGFKQWIQYQHLISSID